VGLRGEACGHFQCPECGFGDAELGSLAAAEDLYCVICLEEGGRRVLLDRWSPTEISHARLRGDLEAA
jgi:hypothetical protein